MGYYLGLLLLGFRIRKDITSTYICAETSGQDLITSSTCFLASSPTSNCRHEGFPRVCIVICRIIVGRVLVARLVNQTCMALNMAGKRAMWA